VGCACGGIAKGIEDAGAFCCVGVDLDEHMIALGREHLPPPVPRLHVCDAVNLHLFRDGTFDALHSAQVAEHWRPDLVPLILRELARVARPGALFFCCLDTTELFERGSPNEDPTHICVQTKAWWREQLADAGWRDRTAELNPPLEAARAQSDSLKAHDWEYFVCEKS
jgi:ubiquinone/menaquinone biosynthesis C-methylase UbiE